jgi:hypothetical protein
MKAMAAYSDWNQLNEPDQCLASLSVDLNRQTVLRPHRHRAALDPGSELQQKPISIRPQYLWTILAFKSQIRFSKIVGFFFLIHRAFWVVSD